jgi:hypothetical protein
MSSFTETLSIRQIDAALGLLGWSDKDLAKASKRHTTTISRIRHASSGAMDIRRYHVLKDLRAALEQEGIRFTETGGVEPLSG